MGYVTLALDHTRPQLHRQPDARLRYTAISDARRNYAFMWDYLDRSIATLHHSIVGFSDTGEYATPWLEASIHEGWTQSGKPLTEFLAG